MVNPVKPNEFKLQSHSFLSYDIITADKGLLEHPEDPGHWVHVAPQLQEGSEIRILADDMSVVIYLIVLYRVGSSVRVAELQRFELSDVIDTQETQARFEAKRCGPKGWCVVDTQTGERVFENMQSQSEAVKQIEEHMAILGI